MKKLTAIIKYLFFPFLFAQSAEAVNWSSYIGNETITAKVETEKGTWIGTANGLWMVSAQNHKVVHLTAQNSVLPSNHVTSMIATKDGHVYAATNKGILHYDGYTYLVINAENSDLPENGITSVATDNNGALWVGTIGHGLIMMNNFKCRFFNTKNSALTTNNITAVANENGITYAELANKDIVWIGERGIKLISTQKVADTNALATGN